MSQHKDSISPLFSVITVTYNAREALQVTAASVRNQIFGDWENLIIDGASADGTAEFAREYAAEVNESSGTEKVKVLSERDKGLYDAMNKGLERAQGKYVIFLNAGDTFHDSKTLALMAREAENGTPGPIYGQTRLVSGVHERRYSGDRHLRAPEKLSWKDLKWGMLVCHQAMAVRRDLTQPYDLTYRYSADYDWMIKCLKRAGEGGTRYVDACVIDYLDEGVTTKNHRASLRERYRIMCHHYGTAGTLARHGWFAVRNFLYLCKKH